MRISFCPLKLIRLSLVQDTPYPTKLQIAFLTGPDKLPHTPPLGFASSPQLSLLPRATYLSLYFPEGWGPGKGHLLRHYSTLLSLISFTGYLVHHIFVFVLYIYILSFLRTEDNTTTGTVLQTELVRRARQYFFSIVRNHDHSRQPMSTNALEHC